MNTMNHASTATSAGRDNSALDVGVLGESFLLPLPPGEGWGEGGLRYEVRM